MNSIRVTAPAKINLFLRVLGRRPDGYHDLETLFQAIDLSDELIISEARDETSLEVPGHPELQNEQNLVIRAIRRLEMDIGRRIRVRIRLTKRIPAGGGLGGGSSDAAAAMIGVRALLDLKLSDQDLHRAACGLGADVPFFLIGGTAVGEGVGEKLTPVSLALDYGIVLANPGFAASTAAVFRQLSGNLTPGPKQGKLWRLLGKGQGVGGLLHNDLQSVTESLYPVVRQAREFLERCGFRSVLMSGSGPTVFAVTEPDAWLDVQIGKELPERWSVVVAKPVPYGVVVD